MLSIQIKQSGEWVRLNVEQVEFIQTCPYCRMEFSTIDPDNVYCKRSHRVMASQVRNFSRSMPRFLANSTIGISRIMLTA